MDWADCRRGKNRRFPKDKKTEHAPDNALCLNATIDNARCMNQSVQKVLPGHEYGPPVGVMGLIHSKKPTQQTTQRSSSSKINLPSLYFSLASYALSYFHPTVSRHCLQEISRTICRPVVMLRSTASDWVMLTTLLKRYALPC